MEVLTGKVITKTEEENAEKEVKLFTNPVAVKRIRLSFGAIPAVQLIFTAICGAVLWYMKGGSVELQQTAEEIIRRFIGG